MRNGVLDPMPVAGVPEVKPLRRSGLLEVALHPSFASNAYVYLTYHKGLPDDKGALALARGRWDGKALVDVRDLFVTLPDSGTVSRMVFGPDGKIYMSTAGGDAQDPGTHAGKILRLNEDGSVPGDNPFVGRSGFRPEIYTLGHRTTLGLAVHPATGQIWQAENGPNGGDEINVLVPGGNYGWPRVSLGRTYQGPWHAQKFQQEGFIDPLVYWMPSIAVSGLAFYTGDRLPQLERRRIRRRFAHGRDHRHGTDSTNPVQREHGRAASGSVVDGLAAPDARRPPRSGRPPVCARRRRRRGGFAYRTGPITP